MVLPDLISEENALTLTDIAGRGARGAVGDERGLPGQLREEVMQVGDQHGARLYRPSDPAALSGAAPLRASRLKANTWLLRR